MGGRWGSGDDEERAHERNYFSTKEQFINAKILKIRFENCESQFFPPFLLFLEKMFKTRKDLEVA